MTTTTDLPPKALGAAGKIRDHLLGRVRGAPLPNFPEATWNRLAQTLQRLCYTQRKVWPAASRALLLDCDYTIGRLQRELAVLRQNLASRSNCQQVPSAREIAADLIALHDEFAGVELDLKTGAISVRTDPIELEGVALGPFRISLRWEQIGTTPAYSVSAEEPNCPDERPDVTHPHVQENCLCEGAGAAAIAAALGAGRLFDFFVLVRQILTTYNPQSAHVLLANWQGGSTCASCGAVTSGADCSACERCDDRCCADCIESCSSCGDGLCSHCSDSCAHCDERFCNRCLTPRAGTIVLLCDACREVQPEGLTHDIPNDTPASSSTSPIPTTV